jgi:hypothetical protein
MSEMQKNDHDALVHDHEHWHVTHNHTGSGGVCSNE